MSEMIWKTADGEQSRRFIIAQDLRFQRAMRTELFELAADRGVTLLPKQLPPLPMSAGARKPRDVITIAQTNPSKLPMTQAQQIMREVCSKHSVTRAELVGGQRSRHIVAARQEAAYRMKKETTLSLPQIGRRLGGKDHATILYCVRRHEAKLNGEVYRPGRVAKAKAQANLGDAV